MRSPDNKQRGIDSEKRIIKHLSTRGKASAINNDNDNPDILWKRRIEPLFEEHYYDYALEAKSVTGITMCQVGVMAITKEQWDETREYANNHQLYPSLIVEIIVKGSFNMYWLLNADVIDMKMRKTMASFTVWQVINLGEQIR